MNIEDIEKKIEIPEEPLIVIFEMQRGLMQTYDQIERQNEFHVPSLPYYIDDVKVQARIKDMFWRTTEELAEAIETIPDLLWLSRWKEFWDAEVSIRHFFEELADALHFLVEASIIASLDPRTEVIPVFELRPVVFNINDDSNIEKLIANVIFSMGLAANVLKNKPWKQTHMPTDVEKFKNKLIKVWSDFGVLWQELQCSLEDVYVLYVKKHDVNKWRQETLY